MSNFEAYYTSVTHIKTILGVFTHFGVNSLDIIHQILAFFFIVDEQRKNLRVHKINNIYCVLINYLLLITLIHQDSIMFSQPENQSKLI